MVIENINTKTNIEAEEIEITLSGRVDSFEEANNMYNLLGRDISYCEEEQTYEMLPEPLFGGSYYSSSNGELIYIEKVIYSKPIVVIFWSDGLKTKAKCDKEDIWNPELGLMLGVMKKIMGPDFTSKLYRDWAIQIDSSDIVNTESATKTITLKDVRRNLKDNKEAAKFVEAIKGK